MPKQTTQSTTKKGITAIGLICALLIPAFMGVYIDYSRDRLVYGWETNTINFEVDQGDLAPLNKSIWLDGQPSKVIVENVTNARCVWTTRGSGGNLSFQDNVIPLGNNTYRVTPNSTFYDTDDANFFIGLDIDTHFLGENYIFVVMQSTFEFDNPRITWAIDLDDPPHIYPGMWTNVRDEDTYYAVIDFNTVNTFIEPFLDTQLLLMYQVDLEDFDNMTSFDVSVQYLSLSDDILFEETVLWTFGLSISVALLTVIILFNTEAIDIKRDRKPGGKS